MNWTVLVTSLATFGTNIANDATVAAQRRGCYCAQV